jgi:type I restriction enzyme, S subunit
MNAEGLLRHYERIADGPDAVRRLRGCILDLATRGKLTEQRTMAETAQALIARLGLRVDSAAVERFASSPLAFDLPRGWSWVNLGSVTELITSGSRDWAQHYSDQGAIFVRMGNLSKDSYALRLDSIQRVQAPESGEGRRTRLEAGDLLVSITGDVGMLGLIPEGFGEAYINQHTCLVRFLPELRGRYFPEVLRSSLARVQFNAPQRGIKNSFRLGDVGEMFVPLPPIEEQQRIVAKVDGLMALCDRLEAARAEREAARDRLTAATLARLSAPDSDAFDDDARFALDALSALTARPDQVQQIRRTILTLAVRGKLLRSQAATEDDRTRLPHAEADLPPQWRWVCAEEVCEVIVDCPHSTPKFVPNGVVCLDTNAFKGGAILPAKIRYVTEQDYEVRTKRLIPRPGDIVFAREGSVGESVIVPDGMRCCLGQRVMLFRPLEILDSSYFQLALSEPSSLMRLLALHKGIGAKHVNVADMRKALIPLPPLTEQRLIVEKVEELMSWCDQLEASLQSAVEHRSRLLVALLRDALHSSDRFEEFHPLREVTAA